MATLFNKPLLLLLLDHPLFFLSLQFDISNSQFVWSISSARASRENDPPVCGGEGWCAVEDKTTGAHLEVMKWLPKGVCERRGGKRGGGKFVLNWCRSGGGGGDLGLQKRVTY